MGGDAMGALAEALPLLAQIGGGLGIATAGLMGKQKKANKKTSSKSSSKSGGSGSKSAVVTSQKDFSGVSTRTKKRSRSSIKKSKAKAKKTRAFKKKVKKALRAPRHYTNFVTTIGRSYISPNNGQTNILIPIYGWRGAGASTASDAVGALTPGNSNPALRADTLSQMQLMFENSQLYPSSTTANTAVNQWWFKHSSSKLDLTFANTGIATEGGGAVDRAVPIEYELYLIYAGKSSPTDPAGAATNDILQVFDNVNANTQAFGSLSAPFTQYTSPNDPAWEPQTLALSGKYIKSKYLGRGYIESGGKAVRYKLTKTRGKSGFYSKQKIDKMDAGADDTTHGIYPGHSCHLMISFRGIPKTPTVAYPQSRLTVLCNWDHQCYADGTQVRGGDTVALYTANSIA